MYYYNTTTCNGISNILIHGREVKMMKTAIFIPVALMLVFFAPLSSAEVMELNVSPQVVDSGDVITISGKASPDEVV